MNRQELLNNIKRYLANFQTQVQISTDNNEYDINIHAENFMIPLLNILLKADFKSLHYEDKNAQGIDLLDTKSGIAIQVTSTKRIQKIKDSLKKLSTSLYAKNVKQLYIFILTTKQASYSQSSINGVIAKKIRFNTKEHIWDNADIYKLIQKITDIDLIKEIENLLRKNFSELYLSESFSETNYEEFKKRYTQICIDNFSRLNFFGLSIQKKPREVNLYDLFVKPIFSSPQYNYPSYHSNLIKTSLTVKDIDKTYFDINYNPIFSELKHIKIPKLSAKNILNDHGNYIDFEFLFSQNKHLVLLGNPGAGKSSIIKYAITSILKEEYSTFEDKEVFKHFPLRVEIHKYNQFKIEKKSGIVEYISVLLADEYQLQLSPTELSGILKFYPTIVFFDGLDEIFDIQQRIQVRNDIESFIKRFNKTKSIVTSRFESYTEVSLDAKVFKQVEVKNFNKKQIEDYVNKWYNLEEKNPVVKIEEINNCMKQLDHVDNELKCNPLLLSLILILYRNELEIPTSKLEIYENCTTTIVDHRDNKEKKLLFDLTISNPIAIFSALAYWQFDHENKEIDAEKVLLFVKKHLLDKGEIEDDYEATCAANEFLDFAKLRSIYYENKFTHKTFLEYFTSYYIYSAFFTKPNNQASLEKIITKNISLSSWAVVLELLICKIDSMQIDFEVIDSIIEKQLEENQVYATLFFLTIIRYLKNVSPRVRQKLIDTGISVCLTLGNNNKIDLHIVELIFNSLVSISKINKFKSCISISFEKNLKLPITDYEALYTFAHEFQIANNQISLVNLLDQEKYDELSAHVNFLRHLVVNPKNPNYLQIIDETKFLKNNKSGTFKLDFESMYGHPIFSGSSNINIAMAFIITNINNLGTAYQKLINVGVSITALEKIASQLSPFLSFQALVNGYKNTEDKQLKNLIKITMDMYKTDRKANDTLRSLNRILKKS